MEQLKIAKTTLPTEPLSEFEWYEHYKVSSQFISQQLFDMYNTSDLLNPQFANIIKDCFDGKEI